MNYKFHYKFNLFLFTVNAMLFIFGNTSKVTILCMFLHAILGFYYAGKIEDKDESDV